MKYKTLTILAGIAFLGSMGSSRAQHDYNDFGAGVILGEPTGLTAKYWTTDTTAVDAGLGWSFEGRDSLHIHASYLFHDFEIAPVEKGQLPLYVGVGGRFKARSGETDRLGVRVPFGVAYHFEPVPVEVFGEIVPILDLAPSTRGSLNAAVGARYYFE